MLAFILLAPLGVEAVQGGMIIGGGLLILTVLSRQLDRVSRLFAHTTTVAASFKLLGCVANIIVTEKARDHYTIGFRESLRFGLPSTIWVLVAGVATICDVMKG